MQSVLVLGGSYFIGKKVVEELLKQQFQVTVLNRGSRLIEGTRQLIANRDDEEEMKEALKGQIFDYVIDIISITDQHSKTVYEAVDKSSLKKWLFISSSGVYDIDHEKIPFSESTNIAENSIWTFYGAGKISCEAYYKKVTAEDGVDFVAIRPPYVYGECNYAPRESFIFYHLEHNLPIVMPNKGESLLQFVEVNDLAKIVHHLLTHKMSDTIYNVGSDTLSFKGFIQACAEVVGILPKIVPFDYKAYGYNERTFFPFFDYSNVLDTSRLDACMSYQSPFEEGLKKSYEWYKNNKEAIKIKPAIFDYEKEILAKVKRDKVYFEPKENLDYSDVIGMDVEGVVDRPLGSKHPKHDFIHELNYGYVTNVYAPDGSEQDVYLIDETVPVNHFKGKVIAVVHRYDDTETKWVVSTQDQLWTKESIKNKVDFIEKYFKSVVVEGVK